MPSDVQPAGELPGPLATGPPSAVPTRVNTSTLNAAFAAAVLAVVMCVIVKFPDVAVTSKNIAQLAEPPLLAGPGLAFRVCACRSPAMPTTAPSASNLEQIERDGFIGTLRGFDS